VGLDAKVAACARLVSQWLPLTHAIEGDSTIFMVEFRLLGHLFKDIKFLIECRIDLVDDFLNLRDAILLDA
jgi:hypothetical protein